MNSGSRSRALSKPLSLTRIRRTILVISILGTFLIGIRHLLPGEAGSGGSFDAFCPFGAIESFWSYVTTGYTLKTINLLNFAILAGVIGVALTSGRAFCGWMCPLGAVQEFLAVWTRRRTGEIRHIRGKPNPAKLPMRLPSPLDRGLRYLKYGILAVILLASTVAIFPPLHDLCPARAVFSFQLGSALLWGVLILFIASSLLVERFSCKYLCPLGAFLAVFNKFSPLHLSVDSDGCNNCGRCDTECPMDIEDVPHNLRSTECMRCLECLETCARKDTIALRLG